MQIALLRSLLNKKGAKVVVGSQLPMQLTSIEHAMRMVALVYRAKRITTETNMKEVLWGSREQAEKEITILTLLTNDRARRLVQFDLRVLRELHKQMDPEMVSAATLVKKLGAGKKEVSSSLRRLKELDIMSKPFN